jgi:creatinine deaminase
MKKPLPDDLAMHAAFMDEALREAREGLAEGGIPIGSVLVRNGKVIGRGHNRRVQENDPVMHAEIDCLRNAGRRSEYRDCILYSTLMPCYLCAGAVVQFRIPSVVAGESRNFAGAREFLESRGVRVLDLDREDCRSLLSGFIRDHPAVWNEDIGEL